MKVFFFKDFYHTCFYLGPEYLCNTQIPHDKIVLKCFASNSRSLIENHIFYFKL